MPKKLTRVVIVSPTYNEKGNIARLAKVLFEEIFPKLEKEYDCHVLIVDDSSPDGTGQEVLRLSKIYKSLHLMTNKKKLGLGNAYTKGMTYAIDELEADIVFSFDADFQHDPTRIPLMLNKLNQGNDIVLGARYIPGGSIPDTWGFHRKFLSIVGNFTIRVVITNFSIHDWTTGYRAIRRKVVRAVLPEMNSDTFMGYTFQIGLLHKAVRKGFKVSEVPLKFVDRTYGKSKLGAEYVKNTLLYIFKVRFNEIINSRVFKFGVVGGIGSLIQMIAFSILPFSYHLAVAISIEMAIISNFILNNIWTFTDKKLSASTIPTKFLKFNLASFGSILIQFMSATLGKAVFGLAPIGKFFGLSLNTGHIYLAIGIGLGMVWNYIAYNRLIWNRADAAN